MKVLAVILALALWISLVVFVAGWLQAARRRWAAEREPTDLEGMTSGEITRRLERMDEHYSGRALPRRDQREWGRCMAELERRRDR